MARPGNLAGPVVCYVTDRSTLGGSDVQTRLSEKIRTAANARADWVQIREKDMPTRDLLALAREAIGAIDAASAKTRVIINDRLDIALAIGAAGTHLGGKSVPVRDVVRWCRAGNAPSDFLIGVSCHRQDEVREAELSGADYAFFGPLFDTPSKRPFGSPQGIAQLEELIRTIRIPVIAIGGVNAQNAEECIKAGAAGIAAIRLFQEPRDPVALRDSIATLHQCSARPPGPS